MKYKIKDKHSNAVEEDTEESREGLQGVMNTLLSVQRGADGVASAGS